MWVRLVLESFNQMEMYQPFLLFGKDSAIKI